MHRSNRTCFLKIQNELIIKVSAVFLWYYVYDRFKREITYTFKVRDNLVY